MAEILRELTASELDAIVGGNYDTAIAEIVQENIVAVNIGNGNRGGVNGNNNDVDIYADQSNSNRGNATAQAA